MQQYRPLLGVVCFLSNTSSNITCKLFAIIVKKLVFRIFNFFFEYVWPYLILNLSLYRECSILQYCIAKSIRIIGKSLMNYNWHFSYYLVDDLRHFNIYYPIVVNQIGLYS